MTARIVALGAVLAVAATSCTGRGPAESPPTLPPALSSAEGPRISPSPASLGGRGAFLAVEPAIGPCDADLMFTVRGLAHNEALDLRLWSGFDIVRSVAPITADGSGIASAQINLHDVAPGCVPGSEYTFEIVEAGVMLQAGAPQATYSVAQIGRFWLEPDHGPCGEIAVVVRAEDLPPGISVPLLAGGTEPFAHNFVELETAITGEDGGFELPVTLNTACDDVEVAVLGSHSAGGLLAKWKAIYTIDTP